jgi:hypothetical protein
VARSPCAWRSRSCWPTRAEHRPSGVDRGRQPAGTRFHRADLKMSPRIGGARLKAVLLLLVTDRVLQIDEFLLERRQLMQVVARGELAVVAVLPAPRWFGSTLVSGADSRALWRPSLPGRLPAVALAVDRVCSSLCRGPSLSHAADDCPPPGPPRYRPAAQIGQAIPRGGLNVSGWFGLVSDPRGRDYGSMSSTTTIAAGTCVSFCITRRAWALNGSSEA